MIRVAKSSSDSATSLQDVISGIGDSEFRQEVVVRKTIYMPCRPVDASQVSQRLDMYHSDSLYRHSDGFNCVELRRLHHDAPEPVSCAGREDFARVQYPTEPLKMARSHIQAMTHSCVLKPSIRQDNPKILKALLNRNALVRSAAKVKMYTALFVFPYEFFAPLLGSIAPDLTQEGTFPCIGIHPHILKYSIDVVHIYHHLPEIPDVMNRPAKMHVISIKGGMLLRPFGAVEEIKLLR